MTIIHNALICALLGSVSVPAMAADYPNAQHEDSSTAPIRGLIKPVNQAIISSEIAGQVSSMPFRAGQRFKKGDTLVAFNCSFYLADLAAAQARFKSKKLVYQNNVHLRELDAISDIEVSVAEGEMDMAEAEMHMRAIRADRCRIAAPYSGRVIERFVNEFDTLPEGTQILSILDDSNLEIELIIPSDWLTWLDVGKTFSFKVDETGDMFEAKVKSIGSVVDPVSQTVKLLGSFTNPSEKILAGMSGSALFAGTRR